VDPVGSAASLRLFPEAHIKATSCALMSEDGRGEGKFVQAGSLYDWLGKPTLVYRGWGAVYEVLP